MDAESLSGIVKSIRSQHQDWSTSYTKQDPQVVLEAWPLSNDPSSLLLLLAALFPARNATLCFELCSAMSFFPPAKRELQRQVVSQTQTYNGRDRVSPLHIAQRMMQWQRDAPWSQQVARELCAAIRSVVPNPYALSRRDGC